MKLIIKIIGIGFLIAGLAYFANLFGRGGFTTNVSTLVLRLINAAAWILTGYGLLNLRKWSLYGLGTMIGLYIFTNFYNLYFTKVSYDKLSLVVPALHILLLLFLYSKREKFLIK